MRLYKQNNLIFYDDIPNDIIKTFQPCDIIFTIDNGIAFTFDHVTGERFRLGPFDQVENIVGVTYPTEDEFYRYAITLLNYKEVIGYMVDQYLRDNTARNDLQLLDSVGAKSADIIAPVSYFDGNNNVEFGITPLGLDDFKLELKGVRLFDTGSTTECIFSTGDSASTSFRIFKYFAWIVLDPNGSVASGDNIRIDYTNGDLVDIECGRVNDVFYIRVGDAYGEIPLVKDLTGAEAKFAKYTDSQQLSPELNINKIVLNNYIIPLPHLLKGFTTSDGGATWTPIDLTGSASEDYNPEGSTYLLDNGATIDNGEIVPNDPNGDPITGGELIQGSATNLNSTHCYVDFKDYGEDVEGAIYNREDPVYWDPNNLNELYFLDTNPYAFHTSEMTQDFLDLYLQPAWVGRIKWEKDANNVFTLIAITS